jgi:serine/threonine protein kinase
MQLIFFIFPPEFPFFLFFKWLLLSTRSSLQSHASPISLQVKTCKHTADDASRKDFLQEATLLSAFSHPNVMGLVAVVTTQDPLLIVLDYVTYGDMRAVLKACRVKGIAVTPAEKLFMATQVCVPIAWFSWLIAQLCLSWHIPHVHISLLPHRPWPV